MANRYRIGAVVKAKIIGWTTLGAVLIVSIAAINRSGSTQDASEQSSPPEIYPGDRVAAVDESTPHSVTTNGVAARGGTTVDGYDVLAERQTVLANGDIEHRRLVRRSGKSPYRILVETLRKDPSQSKFAAVGRMEMVADHVLVNLQDSSLRDELEQLADRYNAKVVRVLADEKTFVVRLEAPGLDAIDQAIKFFTQAASSVAYAEPDYVRHFSSVPNDPMYGNLWGMPKISMPDAWDISTGNSDIVVAVIDTGMDMDHPDLAGNLWINAVEIPGDGTDNDGNGYVDDINGWDFVNEDDDPEDGDGHGTHCAGTVGAVGNNANQVAGVCWTVSIMPLRVGNSDGLFDSDIVDGIRYAARNGAKVLSNSYGGTGFSQTVYDAIEYANTQGSIFVAAAGNDSSDNDLLPQYPASYELPNVIAVAATDENDNLASFSNYGVDSVDLAAPGVNILSTYLNGQTETLQGTSMACPHVAGAMALLASIDEDIVPAEAKQVLLDSVDEIPALDGKLVTGGRMNVFAMFASANDTDKDGMPDSWELNYGLNPNDPLDAALDGDGDFLTNLEEFLNSCIPTNPDSDGDSLIDGWEVLYGFNPRNVMGTLPKLQYLGSNSQCLDTYETVVTNGLAFVADGAYGLKVLSLAHPENPDLIGSYATSGSARGVAVEGSLAYVADVENGLFIIDISDPTDPLLVSTVAVPASKVDLGGGFAYLASVSNGLSVIDVSDPTNAVETATFDGNGDPGFLVNDIELVGGYVYMALDGGLGQIATSANPATYTVKSIADGEGNRNCTSLYHDNSILYLSLQDYGVLAYNLSKTKLGGAETPGSAEDVAYHDGLIYVADGTKGLRILNASDLSNITPHAGYANVQGYGVTIANGYAYVAGKASGLQIFRSSIDSDEDGMYDSWEILHFGNLDQDYIDDFETIAFGTNTDHIINWGEYLANLDPTNPDQDADGLNDGDEVRIYLTDPRTPDTDGDGLDDGYEVTANGVDNLYLTDPLTADTDGDGMSDKWEIDNGLNPLVADADNDPDGDGATNLEESQAGTDPANPDTDADGIPDGWEIDMGIDPLVDDAADDPDGDTLTNLDEYGYNTNPLKADTDDDGLTDPEEIFTYFTDPNDPDSDGDGMPDGWEIDHSLNPLVDDAAGDLDGDGLSNYEEYLNGSDPFNADTDGDGFADDWERDWGTMATNAADPLVVDDDGPYDWWMYGGQPQDPQLSDPDENGSIDHPFDAIQEAINVASNGITILVRSGQYYGFGNRNINLASLDLRILAENQADPSSTVVKSHGLSAVFVFQGGQTTNTVLAGFTIQSSMQGIDCSNGDCGEENGIICSDASSPLITNCVVEICRDDAVYCEFNSNPTLIDVTIQTIYEGNGIYARNGSTPTVINCTITDIFQGSGIHAVDSVGLDVIDSTISNCRNVFGSGRGIWLQNDASAQIINTTITGCQGGIRCDGSSPLIDRCTISDNTAPDYYTVEGAGFMANTNIALWAKSADNDAVDEQHEEENGGGLLLQSGSLPTIRNCVITDNRTVASDPEYSSGNTVKPYYGLGGGIYSGQGCAVSLINCTIAYNEAMTLGGGFTTYGNYVEHLRNDIIWSNRCNAAFLDESEDPAVFYTPGNAFFNALHCNEGTSHFDPWYCNISDGFGFVVDRYNFEADPLFVGGGDYHITSNSPCIDVGTYYEAPLYDRDGVQRPLDGDALTNTYYTVDIGAYEYVNPSADTDGDGTLDIDEIANGTDPTTMGSGLSSFMSQYGLSSTTADNDSDGVSNIDEYNAGTDPTNPDTDGDLFTDGDEMIAGTIATDPASYFHVADIRPLNGGGCEVVFDSVAGRYYTVYCSLSLGDPWQVLIADEPGDGDEMIIVDPSNVDGCFYKVEVEN